MHALQYKLDRTRRLLEAEMAGNGGAPAGPTLLVDTTALRNRIVALREAAEHLQARMAPGGQRERELRTCAGLEGSLGFVVRVTGLS